MLEFISTCHCAPQALGSVPEPQWQHRRGKNIFVFLCVFYGWLWILKERNNRRRLGGIYSTSASRRQLSSEEAHSLR